MIAQPCGRWHLVPTRTGTPARSTLPDAYFATSLAVGNGRTGYGPFDEPRAIRDDHVVGPPDRGNAIARNDDGLISAARAVPHIDHGDVRQRELGACRWS